MTSASAVSGMTDSSQAAAEKAVRDALTAFAAAYEAQDLDRLVDAWSDEAVDIQHGLPTAVGAEAIAIRRQTISESFARFDGELAITLDEVTALAPDWVLVRGALEVRLTERATAERTTRGKRFMEIWRREQSGWRVRYGMTNG